MPANRGSTTGRALSVRVALVAGLVLVAMAIGVVLSRAPLTVVGTDSIPANPEIGGAAGGTSGCQMGGTLPRGTSAIRISALANTGPSVRVQVVSGPLLITEGERGAGWGINETVTVPVKRVPRTISNTTVCMAFGPTLAVVTINGALAQTIAYVGGGTAKAVRFRLEYLRPGSRSWWSMASSVARRMGLGHAPAGTWIVFLLVALMITLAILASRLILQAAISRPPPAEAGKIVRRLPSVLRRIPRAAWICALIACLNAACWSLITPPFQAPDEPSHFAYAQQIAETGTLPTPTGTFSPELKIALQDLHHSEVRWHPERHPIGSQAERGRLQHDLSLPLSRSGSGGAGVARSEPPLYYALQAIPYTLGSSGSLLDRLELMRLLSGLMAGLTALFAYLFVREALPGVAWAWAVGGLGVALAPLLGFMSGVVNSDAMLYAVSAAIFYLLARAFRRGLTPRLAIAIGVATAVGLLTKLNFIGLVPGVIIGLAVLALRGARNSTPSAYRNLATAVAIAASPVCLYIVVNLLSNRPGLGVVSSAIHLTGGRGSAFGELSYVWQFYLPRLPGMATDFQGFSTTRQWFDHSVGLYGWLETTFPVWVNNLALIPAALIAILAIRALIAVRGILRRRLVELAVYAIMSMGLLALIAAQTYLETSWQAGFAEPRYLLPLLPLFGAVLVLGARGAGWRWGPTVGALIVMLFLAHDVFSQLQVVARFYG